MGYQQEIVVATFWRTLSVGTLDYATETEGCNTVCPVDYFTTYVQIFL